MERPERDLDEVVAAAVRRELGRVARRYTPVVVAVVAFALVVAFVPTVDVKDRDGGGVLDDVASSPAPGAGSSAGRGRAGAGSAGGDDASGADLGVDGGLTAAGDDTGDVASGAGGDGAADDGTAAADGEPAAASGVSRTGVTCGAGARQVSWSAYSPPCVPAFEGDNRGATSRGVTRDTIVITYRRGQSTQDTAVSAAAGDAAPPDDDDFLADSRAYIDLFNREYELYGRKVVLRDFQGQGDYIREHMGQGQAEAAADAARAREAGAFADITFFLKGSRPFWESLARERVVAIGPLGFPQSWFERNAPYWYSVAPTGSQAAGFVVHALCRRSVRLKAIYAGDPLYHSRDRVYGLVTPENPEYLGVGDEIEAGLRRCNAGFARRVRYSLNVATFQAQATSMVAQLKSRGVTTAVCFCDPLVPIFLSQAADQQQWYPEWIEPYYRDPQGRLMSQRQWAHAVSNGGSFPPKAQMEAYRAFKRVRPREEPRQQYFDVAYYNLLELFNGLQAAGPNLTPQSLFHGYTTLPRTERGDIGTWGYGPKPFSPAADTKIGWWDPAAISPYDGKRGAWRDCDGGTWYPFDDPEKWGPPGTQLRCFGR